MNVTARSAEQWGCRTTFRTTQLIVWAIRYVCVSVHAKLHNSDALLQDVTAVINVHRRPED